MVEQKYQILSFNHIVSFLPHIGSVVAILISLWSAKVSKDAYNHATGKNVAQIKVVGLRPTTMDVSRGFLNDHVLPDGSVLLSDFDQLLRFNPVVILENAGKDPIGDLRVETRFHFGFIDKTQASEERKTAKTPWATKQADVRDYSLTGKMMPGQKLGVHILGGLLAQMLEVQSDDDGDMDHYGHFEIRFFARLVGAGAYDEAPGPSVANYKIVWQPSGFTKEECRKYLSEFQPYTFPAG